MNTREFSKPLEFNFKENEKVKISPVGQTVGLDGRQYIIDGERVISNILATGLDIPLDENHSFGEAMGWFISSTLELREDGIYATLELNQKGQELVAEKRYRYLSPVYIMGDSRAVLSIDSVGLVNRPNILNKALNDKEDNNMTIETLQAQLSEKDLEINSLKEDLHDAKETVAKLTEEVKRLKVEMAIEKNEILPAQKEFAMSLEQDALEKFIEANRVSLEHLKKKTEFSDNQDKHIDENVAKFAKSIGLSEEQLKKYL